MEQVGECFHLALRNLRSRSLRSWLTIFGIIIGVFLIISLLSLSEGLKATITQQLKALGGEMIFIMPGDLSNPVSLFIGGARLEKIDLDAIKKTRGVDKVLPFSYSSSVMRYGKESKTVLLCGQPWEEASELLQRFQGWSLAEGRWPIPGKREIIAGQQVAHQIFKEKIKINTEAVIKGKKFEIVGILNSLGSKTDDSFIYLDTVLYQEITGEKKGTAKMAMVKIQETTALERVAEDLRTNLQETRRRRVGTDVADFSVITSDTMEGIAGSVLAVIQFAIFAFASIAILVGGIGIMNTMFTSVRERTREIGIMKAIGAKDLAVLSIFLFESGIIGIVGGFGGTILGFLFAKAIEIYGQVHPLFYLRASVTPGLIIFGLVFSFLVGCLAGFFPAQRAAKLKPVDALRRYE
jgi:putative ABC transport system permease protein